MNLFQKKKRELNNNSNDGQDSKKRSKISSLSFEKASDGDVFKDSLKSGDCTLILKRCMENIAKEMESLYVAKKITKETQIKSEFQLESINKTVKFVIKKFDECEKGSREKRWNY